MLGFAIHLALQVGTVVTFPPQSTRCWHCLLTTCGRATCMEFDDPALGSVIQLNDHTTTQVPYALICAVASLVGFVVLGFTKSTMVGLLTALAALALANFLLRIRFAGETPREPEAGRIAGSAAHPLALAFAKAAKRS